MQVPALQNGFQQVWGCTQPYVVSGTVVTGMALVVNHIWGKIAAVSFLGAVVGVGTAFPYLITIFSEDALYINIARYVLVVALPFFGPLGIAGSVAIATINALSKDFRLYSMRADVESVREKLKEKREHGQNEYQTARDRMKEFRENQATLEAHMANLQTVNQTVTNAGVQLAQVKQRQDELEALMNKPVDNAEMRQQNTAEIKSEIAALKRYVDEVSERYKTLNRQLTDKFNQVEKALSKKAAARG